MDWSAWVERLTHSGRNPRQDETRGLPELLIILAVVLVPLVFIYRAGYNSGYRKALEKTLNERTKQTTVPS